MENLRFLMKFFWRSVSGAALLGILVCGGCTGAICGIDALFPKQMIGLALLPIALPAAILATITGLDETAPEIIYGSLSITITNAAVGALIAGLLFLGHSALRR